jgi:hypothetical protein
LYFVLDQDCNWIIKFFCILVKETVRDLRVASGSHITNLRC